MKNILIFGSLAHDRIMVFPGYFRDRILPDQIHTLNVSFGVDTLEERTGGTAGNIAYTLSLLGERPEIIASVGKDSKSMLERYRGFGISTKHVAVHEDILSSVATIITDRANNQITGFYKGAMSRETGFSLKNFNPSDTLLVIAAGNQDEMLKLAREAREYGIPFIVDSGQATTGLDADQLKTLITGARFCTCNDYEYSIILDRLKIDADALLELVEGIAVTFGGKGSLLRTRDSLEHVHACTIEQVKDPTGAGDAFRAGFIKGLSLNFSLPQIGRIANTAASFAVQEMGTQGHTFTEVLFKKRYEENYHETCPL